MKAGIGAADGLMQLQERQSVQLVLALSQHVSAEAVYCVVLILLHQFDGLAHNIAEAACCAAFSVMRL